MIAGPLGGGYRAPGVQDVEGVAHLEGLLVAREEVAEVLHQAPALPLEGLEHAPVQVQVRVLEAVGAQLELLPLAHGAGR